MATAQNTIPVAKAPRHRERAAQYPRGQQDVADADAKVGPHLSNTNAGAGTASNHERDRGGRTHPKGNQKRHEVAPVWIIGCVVCAGLAAIMLVFVYRLPDPGDAQESAGQPDLLSRST